MSNFGSFSYFQTSLSLGVEQGLQKLQKFNINDLILLFHCNILIPWKCPRKTPFKTQCPPTPNFLKASCDIAVSSQDFCVKVNEKKSSKKFGPARTTTNIKRIRYPLHLGSRFRSFILFYSLSLNFYVRSVMKN